VFSTLHTNDAASAVTRLLDLGIEPYLAASSVVGVLAQRLARRVCPSCAKPYTPSETDVQWLGSSPAGMRMGAGCPECRQTGYRGRVGAFELLSVHEPIRQLIQGHATASEIRNKAVHTGMRTLREDGIAKIQAGLTTIAEIDRLTHNAGQDELEA
jgi:type II secretory ATPase GspE/PulE/Tfp pilus assembly ATPase PilB-like protein